MSGSGDSRKKGSQVASRRNCDGRMRDSHWIEHHLQCKRPSPRCFSHRLNGDEIGCGRIPCRSCVIDWLHRAGWCCRASHDARISNIDGRVARVQTGWTDATAREVKYRERRDETYVVFWILKGEGIGPKSRWNLIDFEIWRICKTF